MKKFKVQGTYTISFEMYVIAEDEDEAIDIAYENAESHISTEWNGNSVFVDCSYGDEIEDFTLCADGLPDNIMVIGETEYDDEEEEYEDEEDEEDEDDD